MSDSSNIEMNSSSTQTNESECSTDSCEPQTWSQWIGSQWNRQWVRCATYTVGVGLAGVGTYYGYRSFVNSSGSISLRRVQK